MKAVKSKGNRSTELELIKYFKSQHITGWRRNYNLTGHPDFVFIKKKLAIFTDGCFWHGHNCRKLTPKSNYNYWKEKINRNKIRDEEINKILDKKGWIVIRIWECEIKKGDWSKLTAAGLVGQD